MNGMRCNFKMTHHRIHLFALMWNAGKGTAHIAIEIGVKEKYIYRHIDTIKNEAKRKREVISRNSTRSKLIPYAGAE